MTIEDLRHKMEELGLDVKIVYETSNTAYFVSQDVMLETTLQKDIVCLGFNREEQSLYLGYLNRWLVWPEEGDSCVLGEHNNEVLFSQRDFYKALTYFKRMI